MTATFPHTSFLYGESEMHALPQKLQPQLTAVNHRTQQRPAGHPEVLDCPFINSSVTKCFLTNFTEADIAKMHSKLGNLCGVTKYRQKVLNIALNPEESQKL